MVNKTEQAFISTLPSFASAICKDNTFFSSRVLNDLEPSKFFKYYIIQETHLKKHLMIIQGGSLLESLVQHSLKRRGLAKI